MDLHCKATWWKESLASGETKVRSWDDGIVPGEITTLLSVESTSIRERRGVAEPGRGEKKISRPKPQTIGGRDNYNCKLKPSRSGAIFLPYSK